MERACPGAFWHPEQTGAWVARRFSARREETHALLSEQSSGDSGILRDLGQLLPELKQSAQTTKELPPPPSETSETLNLKPAERAALLGEDTGATGKPLNPDRQTARDRAPNPVVVSPLAGPPTDPLDVDALRSRDFLEEPTRSVPARPAEDFDAPDPSRALTVAATGPMFETNESTLDTGKLPALPAEQPTVASGPRKTPPLFASRWNLAGAVLGALAVGAVVWFALERLLGGVAP